MVVVIFGPSYVLQWPWVALVEGSYFLDDKIKLYNS